MFPQTPLIPVLIHTPEGFNALILDLKRQARVAVDTESNSLHAYRERVCLLQFSTVQKDYVLDPLAVSDLRPLGALFEDAQIEKVFHAAEYDVLCLRREHGFAFNGIFDTMQAARILGRKMVGLDRLLDERFGVKVDKRLQKANWGARPLRPELLQYAAQDTHYLLALRDMLEQELEEKGLLELAHEDFRRASINHNSDSPGRQESPAWARLRARRDLGPRELSILKELLAWREVAAERLDRPAFKVMSEENLIAIARAAPFSGDELRAVGLGERQARRWGRDLLQAVARGRASPLVHRERTNVPSRAYLKRLEGLKAWRKKAAAGMDVESDVVLPRGLLLELANRGAQDVEVVMQSSPWRLRHFGEQITEVLRKTASTAHSVLPADPTAEATGHG